MFGQGSAQASGIVCPHSHTHRAHTTRESNYEMRKGNFHVLKDTHEKMFSFPKGMSLSSKHHMIKANVVSSSNSFLSTTADVDFIYYTKMNNSKWLQTSLQLVHIEKRICYRVMSREKLDTLTAPSLVDSTVGVCHVHNVSRGYILSSHACNRDPPQTTRTWHDWHWVHSFLAHHHSKAFPRE